MPHADSPPVELVEPANSIPGTDQSHWRIRWEKQMGQTQIPVRHDETAVLMLTWGAQYDDLSVASEVS